LLTRGERIVSGVLGWVSDARLTDKNGTESGSNEEEVEGVFHGFEDLLEGRIRKVE
jgi:hypothetical protein